MTAAGKSVGCRLPARRECSLTRRTGDGCQRMNSCQVPTPCLAQGQSPRRRMATLAAAQCLAGYWVPTREGD